MMRSPVTSVSPILLCVLAAFSCAQGPIGSCGDADQSLAAGQWEAARSQYMACLASGPPRFEVLSNLAVALTRLGRMDEAIHTYEKALSLASGEAKQRVRFNLALAQIKVADYESAAVHLARLKQAGSKDARVPELLAICYYHSGKYSLAAREAEEAHRLRPQDAANALILGSAYTRLGSYEKALPLIAFALQSAGSADGHLIMGQTYLGLRLYRSAIDELMQAAALQPELPGLHSSIGVAKVGLGDSDAAAGEFSQALKADPNDFQANYYMGRLKRLDGDDQTARIYLMKAEQLHPGAPEVLFELAAIAMADHDYAKAEPLLHRVVSQQPDHVEAHFLLSDLYRRTGRKQASLHERATFESLRKKEQQRQEIATPDRSSGVPSASTGPQ
jgi:tetratricopeptide (TPR) repeat protein